MYIKMQANALLRTIERGGVLFAPGCVSEEVVSHVGNQSMLLFW